MFNALSAVPCLRLSPARLSYGTPDLLPGRPCKIYSEKNGTGIGFHLPVSFHQRCINIYLSPRSINSVSDRTFDPYPSNVEPDSTALSAVPSPVSDCNRYFIVFVYVGFP